MAMNISEPEISPLVFECQSFMVNTKQVQDCCMKIVNMHASLGDTVGIVIRLAVGHARLDSATGKPDREISRMMIPSKIGSVEFSLTIIGAAKFPTPDHEGILEHP